MSGDSVTFTAPLQVWTNEAENSSVAFLVIPEEAAKAIKAHELMRRLELGKRRGFGSVKVNVTVGDSHWSTSAFPQKDGSWFIAIKKPMRLAEGLSEGDSVTARLDLL